MIHCEGQNSQSSADNFERSTSRLYDMDAYTCVCGCIHKRLRYQVVCRNFPRSVVLWTSEIDEKIAR
jgi:hypothetical protein